MHQVAQQLCRAGRTGAADRRFLFIVKHRRAAHRTKCRHFIGLRLRGALICHDPDDFGDDLTRLAEGYRIADAHIQLADKIAVMQCCAGNRCACQPHRFEYGVRRQHACPTD